MCKIFNKDLVLGIDASNIIIGGGFTHLIELLGHFQKLNLNFVKIIIWGPKFTLDQIPDHDWLIKNNSWFLNKNIFIRLIWQIFFLGIIARRAKCSVLFSPGGINLCNFSPVITMSQNLLPFDYHEIRRFGFSVRGLKFILLRILQGISFKRSQGIIFLTKFAYEAVSKVTGNLRGRVEIIEHGVSQSTYSPPKIQLPIESYGPNNEFKLLYVSSVDAYKHQENVLRAIFMLREDGYNISINFVGSGHKKYQKKLLEALRILDPKQKWASYKMEVPYYQMNLEYRRADMAVFASSCETFGIALLEKMASGLPIVCSNQSCMPEILQDGGIYFNPEDPHSIAAAIKQFLLSPELRLKMSSRSFQLAQDYSWERCANKTFSFIAKIARADHT